MTSKRDPKPVRAGRTTPAARATAGEAGPLSRVIEVDDVPDGGLQIAIRADGAERAALAKSAGLIAVELLEADLDVVKEGEAKFRVSGPLRARVAQSCVVSLEPFESEIDAEIAADFAGHSRKGPSRKGHARPGGGARDAAPADLSQSFAAQLDAPDPIVDGRIDLGALVAEFLVLNLDPYPRKPGVRFEGAEFSSTPDEGASPFAVLKKLKDGD